MKTVKKIWDLYSVKMALAVGLAVFLGWASKIVMLGGTVLVCLTAFYLFFSFTDPALKKKKASARTAIYIFLGMLLCAGLIVMSGSPDPASQAIRDRISGSL